MKKLYDPSIAPNNANKCIHPKTKNLQKTVLFMIRIKCKKPELMSVKYWLMNSIALNLQIPQAKSTKTIVFLLASRNM